MYPLSSFLLLALPVLSMASPAEMPLRARDPAVTPAEASAKILQLIDSKAAAGPDVLGPLWSVLPPITVTKALGTYHGGLFNGLNANGTAKADPINWYGKQFINETSVNPLLCNPPSSVANAKNIVFPYPRAEIAQIRNIEHEGIVSATVVYNRLPLMDYFRVVQDSGADLILLGKSDLKGKMASPPYFYLKKVEGVKIDFDYKNPYPNSSGF